MMLGPTKADIRPGFIELTVRELPDNSFGLQPGGRRARVPVGVPGPRPDPDPARSPGRRRFRRSLIAASESVPVPWRFVFLGPTAR